MELMDRLSAWWPLIAMAATAVFTLLVVRLRTVFATRAQLDAAKARIKAIEDRQAERHGLLEKALADFERRTDSLAGKKDVQETLSVAANAHHRIDLLEKDVASLPTTALFNGLVKTVVEISGDLKAMAEKVNGLDDKVDSAVAGVKRVEDWLQDRK